MQIFKELTLKNILNYTSKQEILEAFFGTNKIYGCFSSPLRKDDKPSFSISRKTFRYKDHVSNETGDVFDLIRKYHNCSYPEALVRACELVGIKHHFSIPTFNKTFTHEKPEIKGFISSGNFDYVDLNIKVRPWKQHDIDYWKQYGITMNILNLGKVFPISNYYVNNIMYVADKYSYAFAEKKDDKVTLKVYQPFSEKRKWVNNNSSDVWELFNLLPTKGKYLIINSSRKDCLATIANTNIPSTCFQAEGILPKQHILDEVVDRFDAVFVLYDNDKKTENWGQKNALKLTAMNPKLINIVIPDKYKSKDFTDLIVEIGAKEAKKVLRQLMIDGKHNHKNAAVIAHSEDRQQEGTKQDVQDKQSSPVLCEFTPPF